MKAAAWIVAILAVAALWTWIDERRLTPAERARRAANRDIKTAPRRAWWS